MQPINFKEYPPSKKFLFDKLKKIAMPTNKTEQYRHFGIKQILENDYNIVKNEQTEPMITERFLIEEGIVKEVPKGVSVTFCDDFEIDEEYEDAMYLLSHLTSLRIICIEVRDDISFELKHCLHTPNSLLSYRIHITSFENKKAQVFETFDLSGSENALLLYGVEANIKENGVLRWIRDTKAGQKQSRIVGTHRFDVKKEATVQLKTFDFSTADSLHLYKIDLSEYSWADVTHLLLSSKNVKQGNIVTINHNAPYGKCVHDARSILRDSSVGIFDGRVRVRKSGNFASARQNSKAVLLDDNAKMYAKPQLEIYTDEVEASHGATIGELDEDALFYLCSRGISPEEAKKMLVIAFADTLIDTAGDEELVETLHADFEEAYYLI
jgi:Fe-S cluster assembly protein SufD